MLLQQNDIEIFDFNSISCDDTELKYDYFLVYFQKIFQMPGKSKIYHTVRWWVNLPADISHLHTKMQQAMIGNTMPTFQHLIFKDIFVPELFMVSLGR